MHNAPNVHPRLDSILKLCRGFLVGPSEFSPFVILGFKVRVSNRYCHLLVTQIWSQRSRSNILKVCSMTHNVNSSVILMESVVFVFFKLTLSLFWYVDDNEDFI